MIWTINRVARFVEAQVGLPPDIRRRVRSQEARLQVLHAAGRKSESSQTIQLFSTEECTTPVVIMLRCLIIMLLHCGLVSSSSMQLKLRCLTLTQHFKGALREVCREEFLLSDRFIFGVSCDFIVLNFV